MDPVVKVGGRMAPLDRADVDTDQIIPKQFLKRIERAGYGPFLFYDWRQQPDFFLNQVQFDGAAVLVAGANFGCGSSREHAPWALRDAGFRAVIAPSFGDIFFNNSLKNGFLPVALSESEVDQLFYDAASFPGFKLIVDLAKQSVSTADGSKSFRFDIDPFRKHCLLNGLDEIGLSLRHADEIRAFEEKRKAQYPWYF